MVMKHSALEDGGLAERMVPGSSVRQFSLHRPEPGLQGDNIPAQYPILEKRRIMRVCIQDVATRQYFKGPCVWTEDRTSAHTFVTSLEAWDLCLQMNHERSARILMLSDDPKHDECLFAFDHGRDLLRA
jgi:hypothetical protein